MWSPENQFCNENPGCRVLVMDVVAGQPVLQQKLGPAVFSHAAGGRPSLADVLGGLQVAEGGTEPLVGVAQGGFDSWGY